MATTNGTVLACERCNGTNVSQDAVINPNTNEVIGLLERAFCNDCDQKTTLVQRPVYPSTFTWVMTVESKYHELNDDYEVVRSEEFTGTGAALEEAVVEFTRSTVIGVDDERWDGNGAPLSTIIKIELIDSPELVIE